MEWQRAAHVPAITITMRHIVSDKADIIWTEIASVCGNQSRISGALVPSHFATCFRINEPGRWHGQSLYRPVTLSPYPMIITARLARLWFNLIFLSTTQTVSLCQLFVVCQLAAAAALIKLNLLLQMQVKLSKSLGIRPALNAS